MNLPCGIVQWHHGEVAHVNYTGQPGYTAFVLNEHRRKLIDKLSAKGVIQADKVTADVVRIENAKPRYGVDISDASLPQETQQMYAVHPSKGCYIGQEIVERVRSRGHVNEFSSHWKSRHPGAQTRRKGRGGRKEAAQSLPLPTRPHGARLRDRHCTKRSHECPLTVSGSSATVRPTAK